MTDTTATKEAQCWEYEGRCDDCPIDHPQKQCSLFKIDRDPNGLHQHAPGAKLDAEKIRMGLVMTGFPRALLQVGRVSTYGARKYSDNGWMSVENGVARYTDAMHRHAISEATGEISDPESGLPHAAHLAWNALARLELMLKGGPSK